MKAIMPYFPCICLACTGAICYLISPSMDSNKTLMMAFLIVVTYVSLWVAYYMLVHASLHSVGKHDKLSEINPAILVISVEMIKLMISAVTFTVQAGSSLMWEQITSLKHNVVLHLLNQYFPVAFLYVVYNNLMIINLRYFDPTSYLLLSSTRLIMTAVIWQTVFGRLVSPGKRTALIVISVGIFAKELPQFFKSTSPNNISSSHDLPYVLHLGLVMVQMLCSVLATVYNEVLLKKNGDTQNIPTALQNMCLCIESIMLNAVAIVLIHPLISSAPQSISSNFAMMISSIFPIAIILTLSSVGIVTSFMLRHLDSVTKAVASSTEVAITTVLGRIIFGYEITPLVALSVFLVGGGAYYYATVNDRNECSLSLTTKNRNRRDYSCPRQYAIGKGILLVLVMLQLQVLLHVGSFFGIVDHDQVSAPQNRCRFKTAKEGFEDDCNLDELAATSSNLNDPSWLDNNLHHLSHWSFSHNDWEHFVQSHISNPMLKAVLDSDDCHVLEIGSGSGAFSRSLLRLHPKASVFGIDYSEKMVSISQKVFGSDNPRFSAQVASMEDTAGMRAAVERLLIDHSLNSEVDYHDKVHGIFHVVMMVGSLCYMPNKESVQLAVSNALENLRIGGFLFASSGLPDTDGTMKSCETIAEREFVNEMGTSLGYDVVTMTDMAGWDIGNQTDRYFTLLRKTRSSVKNSPLPSASIEGIITCPEPPKKPGDITQTKYNRFLTAPQVLEYIAMKFQEVNAPLALIYGTALHEFRAGKTCFMPRITDKDIDIAIFKQHYPLILALDEELKELFGWRVITSAKASKKLYPPKASKKLYAQIQPIEDNRKTLGAKYTGDAFQIDVYGFQCNAVEGNIWLPWDKVTTKINAFLPLKPHTKLPRAGHNNTQTYIYMPSNPACLLENLYGADFRTPKDTKFFKSNAVDEPVCTSPTFHASDRLEFMRQLVLCGGCDVSRVNADAVAKVSFGMNTNTPFCSN